MDMVIAQIKKFSCNLSENIGAQSFKVVKMQEQVCINGATIYKLSFSRIFRKRLLFFLVIMHFNCAAQESIKPIVPINCEGDFTLEEQALLKSYLNGKRIIALGEATHGTHEFFKMKHTFIKYLVKEHGFRLFGMETVFSAYLINDYINRRESDTSKAMKHIYLIYHTQEVLDMINWMREYNDSVEADKKIIFYGIDSQFFIYLIPELTGYIQKVDQKYSTELEKRLKSLKGKMRFYKRLGYLRNLKKIEKHIEASREKYTALSSSKEFDLALKSVRVMNDAVRENAVINKYSNKSGTIRDVAMAENVNWLLNFEGADSKIILWAHNGHIQKIKYDLKRRDHYRMGMELKKRFGGQYYAVGFDFDKGSFSAVNYTNGAKFEPCTVINEDSSSFASQFKEVSHACFFIDFSSIQNTEYYKKL
jgi:erythromycin esterase